MAGSGERPGGAQEDEQEDVLIELRDVAKAFGNKSILSKASFKIRRGEAIGVIGAQRCILLRVQGLGATLPESQ